MVILVGELAEDLRLEASVRAAGEVPVVPEALVEDDLATRLPDALLVADPLRRRETPEHEALLLGVVWVDLLARHGR